MSEGAANTSVLISAGSTNATSLSGRGSELVGWYCVSAATYPTFLKLYNKATAPTVGTDVPRMVIPVGTAGTAGYWIGDGIPFSLGIGFAITKLVANSDTTAVLASDLVVNLFWR